MACHASARNEVPLNGGGIMAFYPTRVPCQHRSESLGSRDLFGEMASAPRTRGIRVVARMHCNYAHEEAARAHPEWFERNPDGSLRTHPECNWLFKTCMFSTYFTDQINTRTTPEQVVTCPGRRLVSKIGGPIPGADLKFENAKSAHVRLSLLMLNDVALTGVSAEVLTPIFWRLKKESPFTNTIMITHANGLSGYIPADAQYNQVSYEVEVTHFAPGCAAGKIVNGLVNMMTQHY